jgi:hypothetical protein
MTLSRKTSIALYLAILLLAALFVGSTVMYIHAARASPPADRCTLTLP